jgi:hypothetical protein
MIPTRAREIARNHPGALHIIYSPHNERAFYCANSRDNRITDHRNDDPYYCPYTTPGGRYVTYPGFLVATPAELLRPPVPTTHSHWRSA